VIASAIATEMPTPTHRLRIGSEPTASIAGCGIMSGSAVACASSSMRRDIPDRCTLRSFSSCSTSSDVL